MTADRLLTTRDVADRLAISESMVKKLAQAGSLPSFRIGKLWRFPASAVDAYLDTISVRADSRQPRQSAPATIERAEYPVDFVPVDFEAIRAREASR